MPDDTYLHVYFSKMGRSVGVPESEWTVALIGAYMQAYSKEVAF